MNKVVVLSDNRKTDESCLTEHGLCVFLNTGKAKVLLDVGASSLFIDNAIRAGIDIQDIDYVFLSHGHSDHTGGLAAFFEQNSKAIVLASPLVFSRRYFSRRTGLRDIGTSFEWSRYRERFRFIQTSVQITDDIQILPCLNHSYAPPKANETLFMEQDQELIPDDFGHELIFCCGMEKLFVYTGCAHHGVLNMLESVCQKTHQPIGTVLGGFHLLDANPGQPFETPVEIREIGQMLNQKYPETRFITGHCTGDRVFCHLREAMSNRIELFHIGYETHL
jgi:7,8-dihydropterin-6-yl-methyl-4-(beta-D-ribofuranosyl)aminobenzene 5'-phosphate synthase